jgi:hypothetical protein
MRFIFNNGFNEINGVSLKPPIDSEEQHQHDTNGDDQEFQKFLATRTQHITQFNQKSPCFDHFRRIGDADS